jgi:hypothetical protein
MVFLSFLMLVSVHGRNPTLMQGGDHLMRAMLFWSIFLPLGARWSFDAAGREPGPNVIISGVDRTHRSNCDRLSICGSVQMGRSVAWRRLGRVSHID